MERRARRRLVAGWGAVGVLLCAGVLLTGGFGDDPTASLASTGLAAASVATVRTGRTMMVRIAQAFAALGVVVAVFALTTSVVLSPDQPDPWVLPEFAVGVTHTQFSLDPWEDPDRSEQARSILERSVTLQNQHIMGFGALNPEPSPDQYDFETLDDRVELMRSTGSVPVITLCCAPDWMKGGTEGATDWTLLETAPQREHFADFAELAAVVAERYPDVYYFQVWNEMKGFYDNDADRWRAEDYTELYNMVYAAVKEVRPDAFIGGPYVVLDSWNPDDQPSHPSGVTGTFGELDQRPLDVIEYWLDNAVGADFIVVDARIAGFGTDVPATPTTGLDKFATANEWLRARTDLPIWWAEWYPNHPGVESEEEAADLVMQALEITRSSGASVVLLWDPNGSEPLTSSIDCQLCLWTDVREADGGRARELADRLEAAKVDWGPPVIAEE